MSDYSLYSKIEKQGSREELINETALNTLKEVETNYIRQAQEILHENIDKQSQKNEEFKIETKNKKSRVYLFLSNTGNIGVTTLSILFGQYLSSKTKNTLYLDLNEFKNTIPCLLGVKKDDYTKFDSLFKVDGEILIEKLDESLLKYNGLKILTTNKNKPFLPETNILNMLLSKFLEYWDNIIIDIKPAFLTKELLSIVDNITIFVNPSLISCLDNKVILDAAFSKKVNIVSVENKYRSKFRQMTNKEIEKVLGIEVLTSFSFPKYIIDGINIGMGIKYRENEKKFQNIFQKLENNGN